jgi:Tfp pilus assembly protein PilO
MKSAWSILILLGIGLIGYFTYVNYKLETLNQIYNTANSTERVRAQLQNIQEYVDAFIASRQEISGYLPMLFPVDEPQALIDDLKSKGAIRGVRMADIELDVPKFIKVRKDTDPVSIVPFKASFHGDFISLGKFLSDLEKIPYIQAISEMDLTARDDSGERILMSIKGALRFFDNELIDERVADAT